MAGECDLCHLNEHADQKVVLRRPTVLFLQNEKEQGALLGSGVIIPVRHAETVFDLTRDEIDATFALLADVRAWMDERFHRLSRSRVVTSATMFLRAQGVKGMAVES